MGETRGLWASLAVIVLVVSGVQLFALGMIGEYLGRLFLKDSGSPMYVARETANCDERADSRASDPGTQGRDGA